MPYLLSPYALGGAGSNGVVFDPSENLKRATPMSGVSDSKLMTFSTFMTDEGGSGDYSSTPYVAQLGGSGSNAIQIDASGLANIVFRDSSETVILSVQSSLPVINGSISVGHIHLAVDLANSGTRKLTINNVEDTSATWVTFTNSYIRFSNTGYNITLISPTSTRKIGVANYYFAAGQFQNDKTKFINTNGTPASMGADGSTPTGIAPSVFFTGDKDSFATNRGTGGSFTLTGTLTDSALPLIVL